MKTANKTSKSIFYFFTSALLSAAAIFAINHYIEFVEQTAGSYNIVMLFGLPLRDFLITVFFIAAGILAFLTFVIKFKYDTENKRMYPFYLIGMGVLWIVLPFLSVYTISRFTGTLIIQTVSGIAIIANVVFMMISVCCGIIAVIDLIQSLIASGKKEETANFAAMLLTGITTGCALAFLLPAVLNSIIGLSGIFTLFGVLISLTGIISSFLKN